MNPLIEHQLSRRPSAGHEPEQPDTAAELAEQLAEAEDRYRRALADLDNYRKRTAREIERRVEESRESLLRDWLEALDSVERALRMTPEGRASVRACAPFSTRWRRSSPARASSASAQVGEPFDPERHEAVGVRESDEVPDRSVVEVARSGFAIGDRVLRPAQVIVSAQARTAKPDGRRIPRLLREPRRPARRERRGHPPRLPQARPPVPPRRQQGSRSGGPLQGDLRGLRGPARSREARALRPLGANWRAGQDVSRDARLRRASRASAGSAT